MKTPLFENHYPKTDNSVWDTLETQIPSLLKKSGQLLQSSEEKTLYYLSTIAACSSLFTRVSGIYHQRKVYPNLFFIGLAPPASGKGVLMSSRTLLKKIHDHFILPSMARMAAHKQQMASLKKSVTPSEALKKPPFQVVFIPGNCSNSKLIQHLTDNSPEVPTLILESEIDTLATANKSDYGSFSDLLRKAFHNEPISYTRKMNDEFYEVENPKLALVLSGTPDQVKRLIGTASDGLFSRFMFYSFNGKADWEDVSPCADCLNVTDVLISQQEEYYRLWQFYQGRDVKFELKDHQWQQLNNMFREELNLALSDESVYSVGVVKRHGVIFFKICMVLSAMRMFELNMQDSTIECSDQDFELAKSLVGISLDSSLELLQTMPEPCKVPARAEKRQELFVSLAQRFTRIEAIQQGGVLGIAARTVDRWLKEQVQKEKLINVEHGVYVKKV